MTGRPAPRFVWRLVKRLLGASLVLIGIMVPAEPPGVPGPLQGLLGSSEATAQSASWQTGRPDACPQGWTANSDICSIQTPACPYSPFEPSRQMQASVEFPEFCEETVNVTTQPGHYAVCAAPLLDFAVIDDGTDCRALQIRTCPTGTRIDNDWCRATIRRSWSCAHLPNAVRRNEFNTCYVVPTGQVSTNAVCNSGAPDFVAVECADYVGNDFISMPASVPCNSYDTGSAPPLQDAANAYWCRFDASKLEVACHGAPPLPPECNSSPAMCLKRGTGTGGCNRIAATMLCRGLQAQFADPGVDLSASNVRETGCEPCLILPFEPIPPNCPEDTYETASPFLRQSVHGQVLQQEHDIEINHPDCAHLNTFQTTTLQDCEFVESRCGDLPPGNPVWSSTHHSGLAVVNSPVIVRIQDVAASHRTEPRGINLRTGKIRWNRFSQHAEFPGSVPGTSGQLVRTFRPPTDGEEIGRVTILGNLSTECVVRYLPVFELVVEELWPDRPEDAAAIEDLFGPGSLRWWNDLPSDDARQDRTEARDLDWWPALLDADLQEARLESLRTTIVCNGEQDVEVWCRWAPTRSGYFRLKAAGAWSMSVGGNRGWLAPQQMSRLSDTVRNLTPAQRQGVEDMLVELGCGPIRPADPACAATPAALGLESDLSDILWPTGDPEELYRNIGEAHRYKGTDQRINYSDRGETWKYTETQPFGISVHEVRVATRSPRQ